MIIIIIISIISNNKNNNSEIQNYCHDIKIYFTFITNHQHRELKYDSRNNLRHSDIRKRGNLYLSQA